MKNCYSLIRFSTDAQQWGTSLSRQLTRAKEECQRRGWKFDEKLTLRDLGVSAFRGNNFDRKFALGKFLEASKKSLLLPNPVLLLENLDRFSRDVVDNADMELWSLVKRGVDVLILSNGLHLTKGDENDVSKRAIVLFEFDRSHKESARKSDLVNSAFQDKYNLAAKGEKVALGNWIPKWVSFSGPKKGVGSFGLNGKAKVIKEIVDLYLEDKSMFGIASILRTRKEPCLGKHGKQWTQGQVRHILTSEALTGQLTIKKQVFKDYFPAVIDQKKWNALQAKLSQHKTRKGGTREGDFIANIFRNRCFCSKCGGSVNSHQSEKGREKFYYKCMTARYDKTECQVRSMMPIRWLEWDFFGFCIEELPSHLLSKTSIPEHKQKVAKLKSEVSQAKKDLDATTDLWAEVKTDKLKKMVIAAQELVKQKEEELAEANKSMFANSSVPAALETLKSICAEWDKSKTLQDEAEAIYKHGQATNVLIDQLADNKIRTQLLGLIPQLVEKLEIDLTERQYRVVMTTGEKTDWRDLNIFQ